MTVILSDEIKHLKMIMGKLEDSLEELNQRSPDMKMNLRNP